MAVSCEDLGVAKFNDRALLRFLHSYWPETVLVTADDQMPREHGDLIARWGHTVATIDPLAPKVYTGGDSWHWEIVHRWVHNMQAQSTGTVYRYNARGRREWKKPRRISLPSPPVINPPVPTSYPTPITIYQDEYGEQLTFEEE